MTSYADARTRLTNSYHYVNNSDRTACGRIWNWNWFYTKVSATVTCKSCLRALGRESATDGSGWTRANTKVMLSPVDHFTGARLTRRAWSAALAPLDGGDEHSHGHRTQDAARACGTKMWRALPLR